MLRKRNRVSRLISVWYDPTVVFAKEEGDGGTGGGGGAAGAAGDKKAEGGGKAPPTFDIPVGDGKKITVTQEELLGLAAKAAGADARFEEAAKLRKQFEGLDPAKAKKGSRVMELVGQLQDTDEPGEAEVEEFFKLLGLDPSDVLRGVEGGGEGGKKKASAKDKEPAPRKVKMEDLDPSIREVLSDAEKEGIARLEKKIAEKVREAIDKDEILSKVVNSLPEKSRQAFKDNLLYDIAIDDALGQIRDGKKLNAETLQLIVQRLRRRVGSIGLPMAPEDVPTTALNSGVSGLQTYGREILADEPIQRVPVSHEKYEENAEKRLAQGILRRIRGGGAR